MIQCFDADNFHKVCDELAAKDKDLELIIKEYGYPPMWTRPNTFETLVHIVLEQQVSLASALAALNKLKERLEEITTSAFLQLTGEELRNCYFSRQKAGYVRGIAKAIEENALNLAAMEKMSDEEVRTKLVALKGIGKWTADIYLMFALQRINIFPVGDIAAVSSLRKIKGLDRNTSPAVLLETAEAWQPYRSIATMMLWHLYLSARRRQPVRQLTKR